MAFPQRSIPQYQVSRLASRPTIDLFLAPDRILLANAIDRCGECEYPATWTGKELLARAHIVKPTGIQKRNLPGTISSIASGRGSQPPRTIWMVETRWGVVTYDSSEKAEAAWSKDREVIHALFESELAARVRFNAVTLTIRHRLAAGEWKAFVLDRASGHEYSIPKTYWRSDGGGHSFELQDDDAKWRDPNCITLSVWNGDYNPAVRVRGNVIIPIECIPVPPVQDSEGPRNPEPAPFPISVSEGSDESGAGNQGATKATIVAEARCKRWLEEQMRESPSPKTTKAGYKETAKVQFAGLSDRAFDRAWAGALTSTGATQWAAPGRR